MDTLKSSYKQIVLEGCFPTITDYLYIIERQGIYLVKGCLCSEKNNETIILVVPIMAKELCVFTEDNTLFLEKE